METLFQILPNLPNGFHYYPGFITVEEELELSEIIRRYPLKKVIFRSFEAKRKVINFGYNYHFDNRLITKGEQIPKELETICSKVSDKLSLPPADLKTLLITEYPVGTVINWHRDGPPFEKIAGISLLSDCIFKLRPYSKLNRSRSDVISFVC